MSYFRYIILSTVFLSFHCSLSAVIQLSLSDALGMVECESYVVLSSMEQSIASDAFAQEARSQLLPQVTANISQVRQQMYFPQVDTSSGVGPSPDSLVNAFNGQLQGTWWLVNMQTLGAFETAKHGACEARWNYFTQLQDSYRAVARAYYAHMRNLKLMEVIDQNIVRDQSLLDLAVAQKDVGLATRIDVTRAQSQVALDEKQKLQQETIILQSELNLKKLLDLDKCEPLVVTEQYDNNPAKPKAYGSSWCDSLTSRPDVQRAIETVEKSKADERSARYEHLPTLSFQGNIGKAGSLPKNADFKTWEVGLFVDMPVFEGYRIVQKVREKKALVKSSQYNLDNLRNQVFQDFEVAKKDYQSRYDQIRKAKERVDLGFEELDLAHNRFKEGLADNIEVIDAQTRLARAQDDWVETIYQYQLADIEMAYNLGNVTLILQK
jgi:outer membrane protein